MSDGGPLRRVVLPPDVKGRLYLSSMPGYLEELGHHRAAWRAEGIDLILCLVPPEEMACKAGAYLAHVREGTDVPHRCLPVPDGGVPEDEAGFRAAISELAERLRRGERVLVHCAAGIGRTGMAAACLLRALGLDAEEALSRVAEAGSFPENSAQKAWVRGFAPSAAGGGDQR